jgi:ankyrin repeat protein
MEALHQPGDVIAERYRIVDVIGRGGVGITYKAEDLKSRQLVALKALSLRQMGDWKVLELFERESRILAQLDHPAIPRYLDYFQVDTPEDRAFYIAQELVEGKSLAELVGIGWRTNESGVRRIATQILEILVYLHSLKPPVIHRDIKPHNLIWGQNAKIFLVDFGAVQDTYRSTFAKGSTIIGTYGYMAPEQFLGQAVPATDLYGLGATILFLLTHRSPADLPQDRLKISFRSRIQVSPEFANWLEKMLEPDAEDRFSSAKEALELLHGRRVVSKLKLRRSVPWKALGLGLVAVAAMTALNSYKWTLLSMLGVRPAGICEAIDRGDVATVKNYLNQGGSPYAQAAEMAEDDTDNMLDCPYKYMGWSSPSGSVSQEGREQVKELMIAKLSDVTARDKQGRTPLHFIITFEVKDQAERLIAKGADVNAKDSHGQTPLHIIVHIIASSSRSMEMGKLKLLIAKGADVNAKDNYGQTPLHIASSANSREMAKLLIAKGAQVNARDKEGKTPLHLTTTDSKEVAELLIVKGAQVNAKDNQGQTPLHSVVFAMCDKGNQEVAELLIVKGAQVNAKDNQGQTPLHFAAKSGSYKSEMCSQMAELLIAKGAQVNAKDNQGRTPLDYAIEGRSWDVIELLKRHGGIK